MAVPHDAIIVGKRVLAGVAVLFRMLKEMFSGRRAVAAASHSGRDEYPNEVYRKYAGAHARAPLGRHLDIALGGLRVGEHALNSLTDRCLQDTLARSLPHKVLHRPLASYFLSRYFLHALNLDGAFAECGVFHGTSALFLCRAAQTVRPGYKGEGLHLVDSFEGLSQPRGEDYFDALGTDGSVVRATVPGGSLSATADVAKQALREFPAVSIHQGWIPAVLDQLPQSRWAFAHIDVDLFEPTRDCLEYFFPRLCPDGVIVCDDYGSALFPGAHRAWDQFCERNEIPFVVLDTGQAVILRPG